MPHVCCVNNTERTFQTEDLPAHLEPIFCSKCGSRVGWIDVTLEDAPTSVICDDCAANVVEEG